MNGTMAAVAQSSDATLDLCADVSHLDRLEARWNALFAKAGAEPSASFEWTRGMAEHHLQAGDKLAVMQLRSGDRLLGLVPLLFRSSSVLGQRVVVASPLSDLYNTHGSLLLEQLDEPTVGRLLQTLVTTALHWDIFRMSKILEESPLPRLFAGAARASVLQSNTRYGKAAYYLQLPQSFDAYLAARSQKFRSHLKRTTKRLLAAGRVQVTVARTVSEFDRAYESLLQVERTSWKQQQGTSITAVMRQTGFYRTMGRGAAGNGRLHLQVLTLDDKAIAHNLGYLHGDRYSYLKTSYSDEHRALGPATYLRACLIDDLIEHGVREVDFPGEPYEWERQWTSTHRWHKTVTIYNRTPRGVALKWLDRLRPNPDRPPALTYSDPDDVQPQPARAPQR